MAINRLIVTEIYKKKWNYTERALRGKQGKGSLGLLTPKKFLLTPASSHVIHLYILAPDVQQYIRVGIHLVISILCLTFKYNKKF
jgi:hypothetical protein